MVFKLFTRVGYYELVPDIEIIKDKNIDYADVWLDIDNKALIVDTKGHIFNVVFSNYDELLRTIIRIGRAVLFNDMIDSLNKAGCDLMYYRSCCILEMDVDFIAPLIDQIAETKQRVQKGNFKVMIRLGEFDSKHVNKFINENNEVKNAVEGAIEKYRGLCWETYEDDDPDYCDRVTPIIDAIVYAIPEEKSIVIVIDVDEIGEVYRIMNKYDSAYDFLKAVDEYYNKVIDF